MLAGLFLTLSCAKPRDPEALRVGLTLLEGREYDQALQLLRKVREEHPGTPFEARALQALGFIYEFGYQDLAKAEKAYRLFLDKFPQAPNRSQVLWDASSCAYWRNRFEQVLLDIKEIQKLGGVKVPSLNAGAGTPEAVKKVNIEALLLFRRGTCLVHLLRWKEASDAFLEFVKIYPSHNLASSAYLLRARAVENKDGIEAALVVLTMAQEKKLLGELTWAARRELSRLSLALQDEDTEPSPDDAETSPEDISL